MARWSQPQPRERHAQEYREAARRRSRERPGRYGRAGFGYPDGFRGAYAARRRYAAPRGRLYPPGPDGSGWPSPLHTITQPMEERHLRAYRDRDLARSVDAALHNVLGPAAHRIAVYADDEVITLGGRDVDPSAGRAAVDVAWAVPGVRDVRDAILWRRR